MPNKFSRFQEIPVQREREVMFCEGCGCSLFEKVHIEKFLEEPVVPGGDLHGDHEARQMYLARCMRCGGLMIPMQDGSLYSSLFEEYELLLKDIGFEKGERFRAPVKP